MTPRILARSLVALGAGALGACSTGAPPAAEAPVRAKVTDHLEGLEPDTYEPESTTTTEPAGKAETTTTTFVAGTDEEQIGGMFETPVEVPENSVVRGPLPVDVSDQDHDLLACIRSYEGDYTTDTGNGYYGAFQFDQDTWESVGGSGNPAEATPEEQDDRAWRLYQERGLQPWPTPAGMC